MKKATSTKVVTPERAYAVRHKAQKTIKMFLRRKNQKRQALRLALAEAAIFARKLSRSPQHRKFFDQAATLNGIPKTRADGSPYLRLLKYFGLYSAASTGERFANWIRHTIRSGLSPDVIRERMEVEGLKGMMAKVKATNRKKRK